VLAVAVAAFGSGQLAWADGSTQAASEVDVDMAEWSLTPEELTFQAGEIVQFNITNSGQFGHAIEIGGATFHQHSETIPGGAETTMSVTFEYAGEYTYLCPIPGHADLGMMGTVIVEGEPPMPEQTEYQGIPLMRVTPGNNTEVQGGSQEIRAILHDFTLDAESIGGANVEGTGHWTLTVNDEMVASVGEPIYTLEGLEPGEHSVRVELVNNDGTPLDPSLVQNRTLIVPAQATPEPVATPSPEPQQPTGPSVGEASLPVMAQFALPAGLIMLLGGVVVLRRARRQNS
jgi:plastocyanin